MQEPAAQPADARKAGGTTSSRLGPLRFWLAALGWGTVLAISGVLLFFQLGYYPLWSDEADTALFARGIARTGDTSAVLGQNVYAFRNGGLLKDLRGRYQPPLSYYLAAPFVGREGTSAFWPRFPFAVCGLLSIVLMVYWVVQSRLSALTCIVLCIGLLGNASFFLFSRQCRYYALATLLSLVVVYLYMTGKGQRRVFVGVLAASLLLLATTYLAYAALYTALACDYLLFERRRHRFSITELCCLFVPQVIVGALLVWIYNPLTSNAVEKPPDRNLLLDKLTLLWWNIRDLNACEFGAIWLVPLAIVLYLLNRNPWFLRAPLAIISYILCVTVLSPQPVGLTRVADVRYLSALIPLFIFLTTSVIVAVSLRKWWLALPLAIAVFGTNVLNQPAKFDAFRLRSSIYLWIAELCSPTTTSVQRAILWIDDNVKEGQSVWVLPSYMTYSLMYHAPHAIYAWQLEPAPEGQFSDLPPIHIRGKTPPDFLLSFGPNQLVLRVIRDYVRLQVDYRHVSTLNAYWEDVTRPELMDHQFTAVTDFNPKGEAVYIWQRIGVPPSRPD